MPKADGAPPLPGQRHTQASEVIAAWSDLAVTEWRRWYAIAVDWVGGPDEANRYAPFQQLRFLRFLDGLVLKGKSQDQVRAEFLHACKVGVAVHVLPRLTEAMRTIKALAVADVDALPADIVNELERCSPVVGPDFVAWRHVTDDAARAQRCFGADEVHEALGHGGPMVASVTYLARVHGLSRDAIWQGWSAERARQKARDGRS